MRNVKRLFLIIMSAVFVASSGCTVPQGEQPGGMRPVYFLHESSTGRSLEYELTSFDEGKELADQIADVITAMRSPVNEHDKTLISEDMEVSDIQVFGSTVVVRFSDAYDMLDDASRSLVDAGVALSLVEIDQISYVRVTGQSIRPSVFQSASSIMLDDENLRLSSFEIEVFPVDRASGKLFSYRMRIVTEKEVVTPQLVLSEMVNGQFGASAPFDGRMDVRSVTSPTVDGGIRADLYVPVEMDISNAYCDIYSIVNSLCSCRGVSEVTITINGRQPSDRGLEGCDGPMTADDSYLGENDLG